LTLAFQVELYLSGELSVCIIIIIIIIIIIMPLAATRTENAVNTTVTSNTQVKIMCKK